MTKKKQSELVATENDRVPRQRKSTIGDDQVDDKGKGEMTLEVEEKVKKRKSVGKGSLKISKPGSLKIIEPGSLRNIETEKGKIDGKKKVVAREENAEIVGTSMKKAKNHNKNEKEKGGVSVSTRKLRSASKKKDENVNAKAAGKEKTEIAGTSMKKTKNHNKNEKERGSVSVSTRKLRSSKKEDENLNEKAAGKEKTEIAGTSVKKTENHNMNEKEKGGVSISTRILRSASKKECGKLNAKSDGKEGKKEGKKVVKTNTTPKVKIDNDIVEATRSSASKVKEIAEKKGKQSVTLETTGKAQKSSVPAEKVGVTTRSAKKAQLELQKDQKSKKIVKREEVNKETTSDADIPPISGILKHLTIDIKIPTQKTKLLSEIYAGKGGKFMGDQSENAKKKGAHDASSSKAVRNQVSKTKKDGGKGSVEVRRNPVRKEKSDAESKK